MRISLHDGWVDRKTREVHREGRVVVLRAKELELLAFLADRPDRTIPREELLAEVFGYHRDSRSRTVDTTVRRIRVATERDPHAPQLLVTAPGSGYRWVSPEGSTSPEWRIEDGAQTLASALKRWSVVVAWGPPGVGKSRWAARLVERWDGPAVQVSVGADWPAAVARALGLAGSDRLVDRIERWLVRSPCLLVADDADDADGLLDALVRWTRANPALRVLVVRRVRARRAGIASVAVSPLSDADAHALFVGHLRALDPARTVDPAHPPAIVARLGGLPLAIELAATLADLIGLDRLREQLARDPRAVLWGDAGRGLASALQACVDALEPDLRAALDRLCALPVPVDPALAARVAGEPAALAALLDRALVVRDAHGELAVSGPIRDLRPVDPDARRSAAATVGAWCEERLDPFVGPRTHRERHELARLVPVLERLPDAIGSRLALAWCGHGEGRALPDLTGAPAEVEAHLGTLPPAEVLARVEPLPASPGREAARVRALRHLGRLDEAVALAPGPEDHGLAVGEWAHQLYYVHRHLSDRAETERWASRAAFEWAGAPEPRDRALAAVGDALVFVGELSGAEQVFQRLVDAAGVLVALRIKARLGLAQVALVRRQPDAALAWIEGAIAEIAPLGDRTAVVALHAAAGRCAELGAHALGRRAAGDALELARAGDLPVFYGQWIRMTLGSILVDEGAWDEAIATLHRAAPGDPPPPRVSATIAAAHALAGRPEAARTAMAVALAHLPTNDERSAHGFRVVASALGPIDRGAVDAAAAFARRTHDTALLACASAVDGEPPAADLVRCSLEVRLVDRLVRFHSSSQRRAEGSG